MLVRVAKGLKRCLQVGLIFAVVVIIGVGIRLAVGPVEVGFLRPSMEQGLNDQLGDYSVTFDKTILIWDGWDRGLDVRATDVELKDHRGLVIAKLSQVSVGLEASDLLGGDVTPERIILFEPTLSISRRADGSFGFRRDDKQNAASQQLTQGFLAALMKSDDTQLGRLKRIAIIDARLEVGDLALEAEQLGGQRV